MLKSLERKFVKESMLKAFVAEFLEKEFQGTQVVGVKVIKTPLYTRVILKVLDPRRVLGRRGRRLDALKRKLEEYFSLKDLQISLVNVENPWLEPVFVAKMVARGILKGYRLRGLLYRTLNNVLDGGALGGEIVVGGKLGAKGAKARTIKVMKGFVPKAGDPARYVRRYHYPAVTKSGIVGVSVAITPPDIELPDKPKAEE